MEKPPEPEVEKDNPFSLLNDLSSDDPNRVLAGLRTAHHQLSTYLQPAEANNRSIGLTVGMISAHVSGNEDILNKFPISQTNEHGLRVWGIAEMDVFIKGLSRIFKKP